MSIGPRLCTHLSDHLEGRWAAFSWYGIDKVNANGELSRFDTRPCQAEEIVKAFEAIAILIADPPLTSPPGILERGNRSSTSRK